jgi:hypothetical protein
MKKKVRVTIIQNEVITLHSISLNLLDAGKNEEIGRKFRWLIPCMAFSAFRIEALCNLFGTQLPLPQKRNFKSMTYIDKVKHISTFLGMKFDINIEPWKTIEEMKDFRNLLVHAKPEEIFFDAEIPTEMENKMALYFGNRPKVDNSVSSKYSEETAERFIKQIDFISGNWSFLCRKHNHNVDEIGSPKYEIIT